MQLQGFLEDSARLFPHKTALVCGRREIRYADLDAMAARFGRALNEEGIGHGDRVVVFLESSVECVACIFGTLKAGAVFVPVSPGVKERKLGYIVEDCLAKGLVTDHTKAAIALGVRSTANHALKVWVSDYGQGVHPPPTGALLNLDELLLDSDDFLSLRPASGIDIDLAALIYTSGSSGTPKGVMLTHLNMTSAAASISAYLKCRHDDVVLNVLPLAFDYGLYQIFLAFLVGATLVVHGSFAYPCEIVQLLIQRRVTGFPLVPTIAAMLLRLDLRKHSFPCLRYVTSTGAALPVSHIQGLRQAFPGARLYSMYGLTECKRVSYLPPEQLDIRPQSVGRGMPNQDVCIVDECGRRVGPRVTGELVVRGSHVMRGYWNLPEETSRVLQPGLIPGENVLYTGDLFWMDEEGYLYFVGRRDELIKSRGERVSPKEVEDVITAMDQVAEAAVFGLPDAMLGSVLSAVVVPREGQTISDRAVLKHCAQHLEPHAVPQNVRIATSIPRNERGKVEKRELARATAAQL